MKLYEHIKAGIMKFRQLFLGHNVHMQGMNHNS